MNKEQTLTTPQAIVVGALLAVTLLICLIVITSGDQINTGKITQDIRSLNFKATFAQKAASPLPVSTPTAQSKVHSISTPSYPATRPPLK